MYLLSSLASKQKAECALPESVESLYPEQLLAHCSGDPTSFKTKLVSKAFVDSGGNVFSLDSYVAEL